ncbi:hypothetical protein J4205_01290 [Candidatus Pacearchaeota archaeon]|nr:hypothetical protein [Candidatus Pacearchaeota archaeon]
MRDIYYGMKNKNLYLMLVIDFILIIIGILISLLYDKNIGLLIVIFFAGNGFVLLEIWQMDIKFNSKNRIKK